jgi:hypothetical protein
VGKDVATNGMCMGCFAETQFVQSSDDELGRERLLSENEVLREELAWVREQTRFFDRFQG